MQRILCLVAMMYNNGKIRRDTQGCQFNGDKFFATLGTTLQSIVTASSTARSMLFSAVSSTAPVRPRTLEELQAAGYSIVHTVGDPFSEDHAATVKNCLER